MNPLPSRIETGRYDAIPFVGCFGRCEAEIAATIYVEGCLANGDCWKPMGPRDFGHALQELLKLQPEPSWIGAMKYMGIRPDILALVKGGWFVMEGEANGPITPTDQFFATLAKRGYIRP